MAIFPAHIWLPMLPGPAAGHIMLSAIMMNMGIRISGFIHLLLRKCLLLPLMIFALISQWYGGLQALNNTEIKRVAAYSTVSQMGYVLFGIASMSVLGLRGSIFHMLNHGTAKGLLFMSIGSVIHSTGATHLGQAGGLVKKMPWTTLCCIVAAFALVEPRPGAFQSEWIIFAGGLLSICSVTVARLRAHRFYVLSSIMKLFLQRV